MFRNSHGVPTDAWVHHFWRSGVGVGIGAMWVTVTVAHARTYRVIFIYSNIVRGWDSSCLVDFRETGLHGGKTEIMWIVDTDTEQQMVLVDLDVFLTVSRSMEI